MKVCRICKKCNKEFDNEFSFCPFCGEKYISNKITTQQVVNNTPQKIPISETPKLKTCLSCRKNIPQDDKYCQFCGAEFLSFKKQNGNEPQTFNRTTQIQPIAEKEKNDSVKWYNKTSVAAATAIIGIIACFLIGICMGIRNNSESKKIKQENEDNIRYIIAMMEIDGWTCIKDGYTFEKCAEVSRTYLGYNYDEDFYDNHVVVTTKDHEIYYLSGFSKSGKAIDVCIGHSAPDWYIIDASVYKKD